MKTLFVCGTSASASSHSYSSLLGDIFPGTSIRNISIGDQTSIMGLMRTMSCLDDISPGDAVIWEYALLDILLVDIFSKTTIFNAMKLAWKAVIERGAIVVLLITPPSRDEFSPTEFEIDIRSLAQNSKIPILDLRSLLEGNETLSKLYTDDRHPDWNGPLPQRTAERLKTLVSNAGVQYADYAVEPWTWIPASQIALQCGTLARFTNSLVDVEGVTFNSTDRFKLPDGLTQVVSIGIIAAANVGSLWCGHAPCATASCALEDGTPFSFLVRSTRLPCVHPEIAMIMARPDYWQAPSWNDYGNFRSEEAVRPSIFGILAR